MIASKAALTPTLMQLHELYAFVLATNEILDDAPRLQNRITVQAARAIRWKAFEAVVWGDGNGKPLGFMNSPALVTVTKEGGQAAATLVTANILKMGSRLLEVEGSSAQWLANREYAAATRRHDDRQPAGLAADEPGAFRRRDPQGWRSARRAAVLERAYADARHQGRYRAGRSRWAMRWRPSTAAVSTLRRRSICSSTRT